MLRLDIAVVGGKRHALGIGNGLLKLGRQLVETHGGRSPPLPDFTSQMGRPGGDFKPKYAAKCLIPERTAEKTPGGIENARSALRNSAVYWPTIEGLMGPRMPSNSPFSFSGTLNLSSDLTRSSTSALNCASVMPMPACADLMSRPV